MQKNNSRHQNKFCQVCTEPLIYVEHYEYDGVTPCGNYEPYWECPNGCSYPDLADHELTAEELIERGRIDTCTEYGIVSIRDWRKGSTIL